jgi:lipopolysaccharide export system protein LptA
MRLVEPMKNLFRMSALAGALAFAVPAAAQLATNSDAPVDVTADELEVINNACQATWRGNAEALQDNTRLRANVLRIFNTPGAAKPGARTPSCGALARMEAEGSVYYVRPQQRVRADSAVYEAGSETITLVGAVVAVQGQNVLRGDRMVVNTQTGQGQMQGSAKGRNKSGRPRGVFYPNQSSTTSGARR